MIENKISVVIPTFNRPQVTLRAVYSVLNQKNINNLEVIVVDDGSTDNTKEVINSINDPRVKYIYQDNGGVSKARNTGLRAATGELVALLDSDDFLKQFSLSFRARFLLENPAYDVVAGSMIEVDNELKLSTNQFSTIYAQEKLLENGMISELRYELALIDDVDLFHSAVRDFIADTKGRIPFISSTMMFRRESLSKIDLFDETLRNCEDLEFIFRMSKTLKIKYFYMATFAFVQFQKEGLTNNIKNNLAVSQQTEVLRNLKIIN